MEPLGTITMYFPFVDDETRLIMESIMDAAYNYHDFVCRLVERVCTEKSSDDLVHLAAIHNAYLSNFKIHKQLNGMHANTTIARPYLLIYNAFYDEDPSLFDVAKEDIEQILSSSPDEFIAYQMYDCAGHIGRLTAPRDSYEIQALEKMENLVKANEAFSCFKSNVLEHKAWQYERNDPKEAIRFYELAYEVAMEHDDQVNAATQLSAMAFSVKNFDTAKALRLISKSETLSRSQGHSYSIADMQNLKGIVHSSRGEFSASVESYQECIRLHERMGSPTMSVLPFNLASTYNEMGLGEEALEWAMMAIDTLKSHPSHLPLAYFAVARALVNLGRLKEAREYLDEAQEMGLKIADEIFLQKGYIISGQLEMAEGRHLDALHSFERAFEICERTGRQSRLNSSLLRLTECELALFENNKDTQFDETSGPWMDRLERETNEKDIPGIQGRMLLLKAELRLKQGRKDDAALLLSKVIELAENPEMSYLRERAESLRSLASVL